MISALVGVVLLCLAWLGLLCLGGAAVEGVRRWREGREFRANLRDMS